MCAGITPIRSFLLTCRKQQRPATMLYSVRTSREAAFLSELQAIADSPGSSIKLAVTVSAHDDAWTGHRGRIDADFIHSQARA